MNETANQNISLNVTGMKCGGCEANIRNTVSALTGVQSVEASSKENRVIVSFDEGKTSLDDIKNAIVSAGFTVED